MGAITFYDPNASALKVGVLDAKVVTDSSHEAAL